METNQKKTKLVVSVLALAAILLFSLFAMAGNLEPSSPPGPTMKTLDQVQPATPVQSLSGSASAMYVINQPGSYYLTGNISVAASGIRGIQVDCNNVTIDLCGFCISGPGKNQFGSGDGIYADGVSSLAVTNGTIRDFRGRGIYFTNTGGGNHLLKDLRTPDNRMSGIEANVHTTVINCTASDNLSDGIFALHSTIVNCRASNNGSRGIVASNSTVVNCTANNNGNAGFQVPDSTLINSLANGNKSVAGIYATGRGTVIKDCAANDNTVHGIRLEDSSSAIGCTATENHEDGIYAQDASTVINCTANRNWSDGIETDYRCHVEGNHLRHNSAYGLNLSLNASNYAIRNVASNNSSGNFNSAGGTNYMPTAGDNANYGF